jgi:hypothetical protein
MLYHNNNSKMDGLHVQCTWSITFCHETLAKEDVDFQEMDYSDDGDFENEDEKHLLDLVPSIHY